MGGYPIEMAVIQETIEEAAVWDTILRKLEVVEVQPLQEPLWYLEQTVGHATFNAFVVNSGDTMQIIVQSRDNKVLR